jgi:hypothetical protein
MEKAIECYETDRRENQAKNEILAYQFRPGKRTGALVDRVVQHVDAGLRVVGLPGILISTRNV